VREGKDSYEIEHRIVKKNTGEIRIVHEKCEHFRDASGEIVRSVGMVHDITERKLAEEALRRSEEQLQAINDGLERKVEQRTRELQEAQKQFLHAEKLSAIGKLSASIAHEFNNPLQGIMSILQGVRKRAIMDDEDRELLEAALEESDRMRDLIRSLQDFNRPSSHQKKFLDVHQSLDSILLLHKSDFSKKRIAVVRNYEERLPQIQAVPDQIKQVILNLLANAADACHKNGGVITVRTWHEKGKVAVAITDNGVGIQPENVEQIFQPFFTTKPEVKGTGLGLSVSYGIVKKHRGEIRVESQPGEGATFTVLLPIKGGEDAASATGG
jgi:signal transduction histidine kinase